MEQTQRKVEQEEQTVMNGRRNNEEIENTKKWSMKKKLKGGNLTGGGKWMTNMRQV